MFGMPVEWKAVETSPQGIWIVGLEPRPKSQEPVAGRASVTSRPLRRARAPSAIPSIAVLAVPREALKPAERVERQMGRVGKPALQMRGEAIARNDVEADAGQERHAGPLRLGVAGEQRLEHVDLAGDVEVMRARLRDRRRPSAAPWRKTGRPR